MTSASVLIRKMKRTIAPGLTLWLIHLLALQLVLFPALADARPASRAQEKQPLGSLSSVGQVYVSNSVVPAESTIFTGDTLRTNDLATATFTISGKGSYEIASRSQLVFTGSQQYVAELKSGTVVMSSVSGPSGINLRMREILLSWRLPKESNPLRRLRVLQTDRSSSPLTEGSVGIVPLEGPPNGVFLQTGQSVTHFPTGRVVCPNERRFTQQRAPSAVSDGKEKPHGLDYSGRGRGRGRGRRGGFGRT